MNWLIRSIPLQNQNAWTLCVVGIVFDQNSRWQSGDVIAYMHAVCGEFFVSVDGYLYLTSRHERTYLLQRFCSAS
jgi:hypothetical protein